MRARQSLCTSKVPRIDALSSLNFDYKDPNFDYYKISSSPERQLKTGDRQDQLPLEARMVFIVFRRAGGLKNDSLDTEEVFCNDLGPFYFWFRKKMLLCIDCAWIAHGLRVDWPPDLEPLTDRSELKNDAGCISNQPWRPVLGPFRATSFFSGGGPARRSSACPGCRRHFDAKLLGCGTGPGVLRVPRISASF